MIRIIQGQTNIVYLTLAEKSTLENPVYLFSFKNYFTKRVKNFIAADFSEAIERYNEFHIEESETESLLNAVVTLTPTGSWDYTIYEQTSSTNLVPVNAFAVVETGKVSVIGASVTTNVEFERTSEINTVFENQ